MCEKEIDEYIEKTIIEEHYILKQKLAGVVYDKFGEAKLISFGNTLNYIEKWFKSCHPSNIQDIKASVFKKKFRIGNLVITGNEVLFYDVDFFEKNQLIKIKILLDKKDFESAIILIKRIKSVSLLNQNELIKLFELISNNYPIGCLLEILDLIIINLENSDSMLSDSKKRELLDNRIIPLFKKYKELSNFVEEPPFKVELDLISKTAEDYLNKLGGHITYNLFDNSKNTPEQKKYVQYRTKITILQKKLDKFNLDIEYKINIRKKLIRIIAMLGFKDEIFNYLREDIESYLPYVFKFSRAEEKFNNLYSNKRKENSQFVYIPSNTGDNLNKAYNNKEDTNFEMKTLAKVIIECYQQNNVAVCFKTPEFDIIRREFISKYIEYESITNIIYSLVSK